MPAKKQVGGGGKGSGGGVRGGGGSNTSSFKTFADKNPNYTKHPSGNYINNNTGKAYTPAGKEIKPAKPMPKAPKKAGVAAKKVGTAAKKTATAVKKATAAPKRPASQGKNVGPGRPLTSPVPPRAPKVKRPVPEGPWKFERDPKKLKAGIAKSPAAKLVKENKTDLKAAGLLVGVSAAGVPAKRWLDKRDRQLYYMMHAKDGTPRPSYESYPKPKKKKK